MKIYKSKEYLPEYDPNSDELIFEVVCNTSGHSVCYNYAEGYWMDVAHRKVDVTEWRFPFLLARFKGELDSLYPETVEKLQIRVEELETVFEELLQDRIQLAELRDFWRGRAKLPLRCVARDYFCKDFERVGVQCGEFQCESCEKFEKS